jgi:hypothetical protein
MKKRYVETKMTLNGIHRPTLHSDQAVADITDTMKQCKKVHYGNFVNASEVSIHTLLAMVHT